MFDNVDLSLRHIDAPNTDFLSETAQYIEMTGEHNFGGECVLSGTVGKVTENNYFQLTISKRNVNIKGGSLCKCYLGDNFKTLGRGDTQKAIEKLSNILHIPIEKATVSRVDIGQNFMMEHPVEIYYNCLGELKYHKRSPVTNGGTEGLYYLGSNGLCLFYDKIKERKGKGQPIPELYQNRNVLRYEQRYKRRLPKIFNVERVTAEMLYSEQFYMRLINAWRDNYFAIKKINDTTINFNNMKGKKDLYHLGVLSLIQTAGGEIAMINQINEAYKSGKLSKKSSI
jgi:hypothetical protein